jgi:hypothetical protein
LLELNNYLFYLNNIYIVMFPSLFTSKTPPPAPAPGPEVPPAGGAPAPVTTGPVPGFPTTNPENTPPPVTQESVPSTNDPALEMTANPIGLANVEPGQLVTLDTNKYIVKIVTMGATGNVYELIDLGNATTPLTNKKLTDFQFDNRDPQQNALKIATSDLLGYIEFTGTGKIGSSDAITSSKVKSYFVIDPTGNATKVSWFSYPGSEQFDTTNKYIYRPTTSGPTADNIKKGEYTKPDTLIKSEKKTTWFRGKGGRKTKKYSSGKARKQYTRRSTFHNL